MKHVTLAVLLVFSFSHEVNASGSETEKKPEVHSHKEAGEKTVFYCPMHPQIKSDREGQTCSICGMNLVPLEKSSPQTSSKKSEERKLYPKDRESVELSLNRRQMIGVRYGKVETRKLFRSIRVPGRIAFDPELYTAQSEYLEGLKQWERIKNSPLEDIKRSTKEMIKSSKIRLKVLGLSEGQIKKLTAKGNQSESLLISGKSDDNWIYADVFEVDLPHIKPGNAAEVRAAFLQGKTLPARVESVDRVIDPKTRTAKVRLKLLQRTDSVRPEAFVSVTIKAPLGSHLSVPVDAILDTGRETFVFVKKGEGTYEPRKVAVLLRTRKFASVSDEVGEGEDVVVGSNFLIDSESRLRAVLLGNQE